MTDLNAKLASAVTQYDRTQYGKPGYNRYALPQYLARVADVVADVERGAPVREAVVAAFSGRTLAAVLRSLGEPKLTADERDRVNRTTVYRPVTSA